MTWTVDSSDANVFYLLLGKTMLVSFRLGTTTVGGTPSTNVYIKIPDGRTANRTAGAPVYIIQQGPIFECGYSQVVNGDTTIKLTREQGGNWVSSTNNTYIFGQLWIEIQ